MIRTKILLLALTSLLLIACGGGSSSGDAPQTSGDSTTTTQGDPPVATIEGPEKALIQATFEIDGSASTGSDISMRWELTAAPEGSNAILDSFDGPTTSLMPDVVGVYTITLEVTDSNDATSTADHSVTAGKELRGVVNNSTTYSSPGDIVFVTDKVQVAHGVTLTFGSSVALSSFSDSIAPIEVFGDLDILGTTEQPVVVDAVEISLNEQFGIPDLYIENATITNSLIAPRASSHGDVSVYHSDIIDSSIDELKCPQKDCFIVGNRFIRARRITTSFSDSNHAFIRNNYFDNENSGGYAVFSAMSSSNSDTVVEFNTFANVGQPTVVLSDTEGCFFSPSITATNNYWGTTDTAIIEEMILDSNDDLNRCTEIPYEPYLFDSDADTPTAS